MGAGTVKYGTSKLAFKQMENIGKFLEACEKYGLAKTDLFQTVDLYEKQNVWQVVLTIHALGRKVCSVLPSLHVFVYCPAITQSECLVYSFAFFK